MSRHAAALRVPGPEEPVLMETICGSPDFGYLFGLPEAEMDQLKMLRAVFLGMPTVALRRGNGHGGDAR